jgi:hypothetical protein
MEIPLTHTVLTAQLSLLCNLIYVAQDIYGFFGASGFVVWKGHNMLTFDISFGLLRLVLHSCSRMNAKDAMFKNISVVERVHNLRGLSSGM